MTSLRAWVLALGMLLALAAAAVPAAAHACVGPVSVPLFHHYHLLC